MASGLPAKAPEGDHDFASAAQADKKEDKARSNPPAAARASVTVEADGSLMVRQQDVQAHELSRDFASKDEERHRGTFDDDDDGGRTRVVIGPDGSIDSVAVDDISGAESAETIVRRKGSHSDEFAEGALVDEGSAEVSEHSKFDSDSAAIQTSGSAGVTVLVLFILIVLIVVVAVCVWRFIGERAMSAPPKPPAQEPVVVTMPAPPQDTDGKSPQGVDDNEESENRARVPGQPAVMGLPGRMTQVEEPANPRRSAFADALEAEGPKRKELSESAALQRDADGPMDPLVGTDSLNTNAFAMTEPPSRTSCFAGELETTGILREEPAGPPPPEGCSTPDDLNLHLAEGASLGFSTKGKGKGWQFGG